MNDKVFFPVAILFAILMIVGALMVDRDTTPTGAIGGANSGDYAIIPISGQDLHRIEGIPPRASAKVRDDILTLSTGPNRQPDDPTIGPHFKLAADLEVAFAGQKLRSYIEARSVSGADIEVIYSTGQTGDSGWQRFELTGEWTSFQFDYNAPVRAQDAPLGFDYFGIRPVGDSLPAIVEIREIKLSRHGEWNK